MNQEIIDLVKSRLTGALSSLQTKDQSLLVNAINEVLGMFPYGDLNQVMVPSTDNTNQYRFVNPLEVGAFIVTDAELADAKTRYVTQQTIFNTWRRFSHGVGTAGSGQPVLSDTIPGLPSEVSAWTYNTTTKAIFSGLNSASYIGFISSLKYSSYTHQMTLGATDTDNDFISTVIAFVEDPNDLVPNNAYGLDPTTYAGLNVTDQLIPNQHTISLIRGRTTQTAHPFDTDVRYAIVYDMGKTNQQVLVSGAATGVWGTTDPFTNGPSCDVKVVRNGDKIDTYTSDWSDAPGGKGTLRFKLSYDLSSKAITNKFRGSSAYGYGAISQKNANFTNLDFAPAQNKIYDVRNGNVWIADTAGNYTLSTTVTLYTDFGVRRWFYNPVTAKTFHVNADKTWELVGGGNSVPLTRQLTINGTTYDLSTDRSWTIAASGGTVTSVGLSMPGVIFDPTVANSPVTSSGTMTPTLKAQAANTHLAGPVSGANATPTFRTLTNADIAVVTGLLTALQTTDQSTLVNAINEVFTKVNANYISINQKINSSMSNFNQTII